MNKIQNVLQKRKCKTIVICQPMKQHAIKIKHVMIAEITAVKSIARPERDHIAGSVSEVVSLDHCEQIPPNWGHFQFCSSNLLQPIGFVSARPEKYLCNQAVCNRTAFNPHSSPIVQSRIEGQNSWNDHPAFTSFSSDSQFNANARPDMVLTKNEAQRV